MRRGIYLVHEHAKLKTPSGRIQQLYIFEFRFLIVKCCSLNLYTCLTKNAQNLNWMILFSFQLIQEISHKGSGIKCIDLVNQEQRKTF